MRLANWSFEKGCPGLGCQAESSPRPAGILLDSLASIAAGKVDSSAAPEPRNTSVPAGPNPHAARGGGGRGPTRFPPNTFVCPAWPLRRSSGVCSCLPNRLHESRLFLSRLVKSKRRASIGAAATAAVPKHRLGKHLRHGKNRVFEAHCGWRDADAANRGNRCCAAAQSVRGLTIPLISRGATAGQPAIRYARRCGWPARGGRTRSIERDGAVFCVPS